MPEKFNPHNYKSISEMPDDNKGEFVEVEGEGFVRKEAKEHRGSFEKEAEMLNSERSFLKKIFNRDKISFIDIAHEEAIKEDWARGNAGREKLVKDLSEGLKQTPEDVEAFIDRCDEIMSGVPTIEKKEDDLTPLQRKIEGRLKSRLWSYKKGDAVDAVMLLYSTSTWQDPQMDKLQAKLAKNAGEELMKKTQELRYNQPSRPTEEDYQYNSPKELSEWEMRFSEYWDNEVVPTLIEVLRKSEKY